MENTLNTQKMIENIKDTNISDSGIRAGIDTVYQKGLKEKEKSEILNTLKQERPALYSSWMIEEASCYW